MTHVTQRTHCARIVLLITRSRPVITPVTYLQGALGIAQKSKLKPMISGGAPAAAAVQADVPIDITDGYSQQHGSFQPQHQRHQLHLHNAPSLENILSLKRQRVKSIKNLATQQKQHPAQNQDSSSLLSQQHLFPTSLLSAEDLGDGDLGGQQAATPIQAVPQDVSQQLPTPAPMDLVDSVKANTDPREPAQLQRALLGETASVDDSNAVPAVAQAEAATATSQASTTAESEAGVKPSAPAAAETEMGVPDDLEAGFSDQLLSAGFGESMSAYFHRLRAALGGWGPGGGVGRMVREVKQDGIYVLKRIVRAPNGASPLAVCGTVLHHVLVYVKQGPLLHCLDYGPANGADVTANILEEAPAKTILESTPFPSPAAAAALAAAAGSCPTAAALAAAAYPPPAPAAAAAGAGAGAGAAPAVVLETAAANPAGAASAPSPVAIPTTTTTTTSPTATCMMPSVLPLCSSPPASSPLPPASDSSANGSVPTAAVAAASSAGSQVTISASADAASRDVALAVSPALPATTMAAAAAAATGVAAGAAAAAAPAEGSPAVASTDAAASPPPPPPPPSGSPNVVAAALAAAANAATAVATAAVTPAGAGAGAGADDSLPYLYLGPALRGVEHPLVQELISFAESRPYHAIRNNCIHFADVLVRLMTGNNVRGAPLLYDMVCGAVPPVDNPMLLMMQLMFRTPWFATVDGSPLASAFHQHHTQLRRQQLMPSQQRQQQAAEEEEEGAGVEGRLFHGVAALASEDRDNNTGNTVTNTISATASSLAASAAAAVAAAVAGRLPLSDPRVTAAAAAVASYRRKEQQEEQQQQQLACNGQLLREASYQMDVDGEAEERRQERGNNGPAEEGDFDHGSLLLLR
ncbi:hypothetical protein Agub_g13479 [Astrephomene gubernaculifera]|uniref:PPPDE domain-containing protein n=1 Tax=Astrephomene gubernaculifera TaxID=47775 RepID=A0AAD3HSC2_9CHLO|nr:hypothetical protein Agub_g13479 [Astrephomene gubernaculifera]